eukprot:CAMPEP_0181339810 /NCGR_PEP_ID=MMETSP1101-20121128/29487_1 /TAXON_ID=46948 /ORGANISM="Rhodomonas abbreviata, Strain Caron Lab Isolate" /LENGTH=100 /DNA_ID=CAMNT_0023450869 /DNA_START=1 /DNA_END=300 /DNA_ORIENTATION=-
MILADGQWANLATILLADDGVTLDKLRRRAYDHLVNYGHEQERLGKDTINAFTTDTRTAPETPSNESDLETLMKEVRELKVALSTHTQQRGGGGGGKKQP